MDIDKAARTFAVLTFGCRTNEADSCLLEQDFLAAGGCAVKPESADLVVVNTCSVTASADQAARQAIRRIARLNPGARIVATGCYATRQPRDLETLPGVFRVAPNDHKASLVGQLARDTAAGDHRSAQGFSPALLPGDRGRTVYPLQVQTGCDERCSYCIVPATRGRSRSVPLTHALRQAARLSSAGFEEIVLTGVHLGGWGQDLRPASTLGHLLAALDGVTGTARFRLSSLEPMDCSPAVLDILAGSGRFAPHLHLPMQHASDRMLQAMRRPYTLASFRELVARIRERMPDAAIGTDVIVGFPGEQEADADALEAYLATSPVTHLHVFPYSERPRTEAARLTPKVPGATTRKRAERIRAVGRALTDAFEQSQVGRVREGITLRDGSLVLTDNFLKVDVAPGLPRNVRVRVRIDSAAPLQGKILP